MPGYTSLVGIGIGIAARSAQRAQFINGSMRWLPADWRVSLKEHHEGHITVDEFLKNQERLNINRLVCSPDLNIQSTQ
jgi:hypothetical protein